MEIKQYVSKEPTSYWRNQKGNQKISRNKWQWKHNNSKLWDTAKAILRGDFIAHNSTSRNKKNIKYKPNFMWKTTGKKEEEEE